MTGEKRPTKNPTGNRTDGVVKKNKEIIIYFTYSIFPVWLYCLPSPPFAAASIR